MSVVLPQKSKSNARPSSANEYAGYFGGLDTLTAGRLGDFATQGTQKLTPEQIQAYGGHGASRVADINSRRAQAIEQLAADPNLDVAQRQDATRRGEQDMALRLDAINKETETGFGALAQYNNNLTARDLEVLIKAYYGGKGGVSDSKGQSGGGGDTRYANWSGYAADANR